jgi:hypothetical protein
MIDTILNWLIHHHNITFFLFFGLLIAGLFRCGGERQKFVTPGFDCKEIDLTEFINKRTRPFPYNKTIIESTPNSNMKSMIPTYPPGFFNDEQESEET